MRYGRLFFAAVFLICILELVRLWGISPAQMAVHFNAQGIPDRFATKLQFFGYQVQTLIVVVGLGITLQVLTLVVPVEWVNMPNREHWLAPERRASVIDRLASFEATLFGLILLVILAGFELAVSANLHQPVLFQARTMIPIMIAFFVASIFMLVWLGQTFRKPRSDSQP